MKLGSNPFSMPYFRFAGWWLMAGGVETVMSFVLCSWKVREAKVGGVAQPKTNLTSQPIIERDKTSRI